MAHDLSVSSSDVIAQKTTYVFDDSVWELLLPLITGAKLIYAKPDGHKDPAYLQAFISTNKITIVHFVPSMLGAFLIDLNVKKCASLKHIICSGEALSPALLNEFQSLELSTKIHNLYGPTEAAIDVTSIDLTEVNPENGVSIGWPVSNTQLYVLNGSLKPQPVGSVGELMIGGVQVAKGYLNRPELTNEKFTDSPFNNGERLYRTGDLASWNENGSINFIGRIDDQVKIRGYRIELTEIEQSICNVSGVIRAAILVNQDQIIGFFTAHTNLDTGQIKEELYRKLPSYMVPTSLQQLEALPTTINGKLDKEKLKQFKLELLTVNFAAPTSNLEIQLVGIWEDVLAKNSIGIDHGFFELGGDSIKIIRVSSAIKASLKIEVPLVDLYVHDTVKTLSRYILENEEGLTVRTQGNLLRKEEAENRFSELKQMVLQSVGGLNVEDVYPMSAIEKGMVFESVLNDGEGIYHDQAYYLRTFSNFNYPRFCKALELMVAKHQLLRTAYNLTDFDQEVHIVYRKVELPIDFEDVTSLGQNEQNQAVKAYLVQEIKDTFNTSVAPLWRMKVYELGNEQFGFAWQFHHAILDGWSNASFITELNNVYLTLTGNEGYKPEPLRSSYRDFILQSEIDKDQPNLTAFWQAELSGYSRLDLFSDQPVTDNVGHSFETDLIFQVENCAQELGVSVKTVAFTSYLYLLSVLNVDQDIVTGLVTNTRPNAQDADKILGCFLNTIPFRISVDKEMECSNFILAVHHKLNELKEMERLELMEIASLHANQQDAGNPFFDVLFNYVDFHAYDDIKTDEEAPDEDSDDSEAGEAIDWEKTNTFLDFSVSKTGGHFNTSISINKSLKSQISARKMAELYEEILIYVSGAKLKKFSQMQLAAVEDVHPHPSTIKVGVTANKFISFPEAFSIHAGKKPEAIAITCKDVHLSYGELDDQSSRLATYLQTKFNVDNNALVGIHLSRSEWMIVSILAVMKCGATYVPIDINYPEERIKFIETNSKCSVTLTNDLISDFANNQGNYLPIKNQAVIAPEQLSYIIYTSGSTGKPKGVMIPHSAMSDYVDTFCNYFQLTDADVVLQQSSISFDVSVEEIFPILSVGGQLVISELGSQDIDGLLTLVENEKVSIVSTTPLVVNELNAQSQRLANLRVLISGGDDLKPSYVTNLLTSTNVYNTYGPTETTVCATYKQVKLSDEAGVIGLPTENHQVHIVNDAGQLLPNGMIGEICISGPGLSSGYLGQPELTEQKFVVRSWLDQKMYRSGDLGRWNKHNELEFFGRADTQVKIRGYRIETGEIEVALFSHELIDEVVVTCVEDASADKQLVAYLVAKERLNASILRAYLIERLPLYMVPAH
ncbi:MAG: amino acid adenylation domain-containing protein, partial [Flavobacteriales bacterium]|nr:amino acid adenylation domain-containing protein [Flavobacteriales bacterium]